MDEDRIAGSAQQAKGSAEAAAGRVLGDAKLQAEGAADHAAGTVRNAAGGAKDAAREAGESAQTEIRHLREELDEVSAEPVAPRLAAASARVDAYARQAEAAVARRSDALADLVWDHPLAAISGAAIAGYFLGRLTKGATYIYRR
ncbi:CsbD family protein [Siccirubricoccus sp. G192]|uniref:CsbD family protein n=1 Tax=Siccirubricoccus sp. G192 TaxID=2849651 RepID=UPI001C2C83C5|nr:CsbD family protein [Siccirubricoccus sp. G192]MBV1800105.1 CsbD family protein [Siccirubricoccus sp. G192]